MTSRKPITRSDRDVDLDEEDVRLPDGAAWAKQRSTRSSNGSIAATLAVRRSAASGNEPRSWPCACLALLVSRSKRSRQLRVAGLPMSAVTHSTSTSAATPADRCGAIPGGSGRQGSPVIQGDPCAETGVWGGSYARRAGSRRPGSFVCSDAPAV